jgi:hypothetical protein
MVELDQYGKYRNAPSGASTLRESDPFGINMPYSEGFEFVPAEVIWVHGCPARATKPVAIIGARTG